MVTKEEAQVIVSPKDNLQQRLSSDSTVHASRNDREENVPIIPEKPSEDGYNWRKYGQKNVKGNEYIRSYYRCSYPNCQVRKQVERSHDGRITDITYLGKHDHARPHAETQEATPFLPVGIPMPDHAPSAVEDKPSDAHAPTTDNVQPQPMDMCKRPKVDKPDTRAASLPAATEASDAHGDDMTPKRRKKGVDDAAEIVTEKPTNESRVVIQTVSEVDIVNDGYRWRKYGQKMVKGNPNPRSYYRCSTAGCPVKKHVERASHDPKVVITTYEGQHDHTIPPIRTIVPQSGAPSGGKMESNGDIKSKSQENDAAQNGSTVSVAVKLKPTPPSTEEGNSTKEAVTIKTEISPTVQKTQHEPQKDDQMEESKHKIASNEEKMQDEPQPAASKSENTYNQSVKQEKADSFEETKAEAVSTEKPKAKEGDHIDFTGNEITSNVQQMEEADPISAAPSSIDTDNQNVKEEKPATIEEAKTEAVVSTEKQRPDAIKSEG